MDTSPKFLGGGIGIKVTPHSQLSRPITLRCFTSWSPDDGANVRALDAPILPGRGRGRQETPRGARGGQGAPGGARRHQEAPGGARRHQVAARRCQEAPGAARRRQGAPGGARSRQEPPAAPGAPGAARRRQETEISSQPPEKCPKRPQERPQRRNMKNRSCDDNTQSRKLMDVPYRIICVISDNKIS